ncbi:hypothetical protein TESG_08600 [Trichophyton tonsurans CBS 112818]|uniref:Transposase Tc1-like domain-containing protein n=2 Tax=Trichophyton TaxID=5550 RepID=F2PHV9_TRIEC|nr:hypothetical protein TESG_08600 [Trichophyton tonsurans CBS 112818]EGE01521.1 hypothetical protein TEQG_08578 [Trichophyton equinum CBS 127.97]
MPRRAYLSRDLRLQVLTLYEQGFSYTKIALAKGLTYRQVYYTCKQGVPSPKKRTGRPRSLTTEQVNTLINYICASPKNRQLTYEELAEDMPFGVGAYTIRYALRRARFQRRVARRTPPISDRVRRARLQFATEHLHKTNEEWEKILWTDETWSTGGQHAQIYVTRRKDEAFDSTCIVSSPRRGKGWIFWGSFAGSTKGPCLI